MDILSEMCSGPAYRRIHRAAKKRGSNPDKLGSSGLDSLETSGLDSLETSGLDSLETSGLDGLETSGRDRLEATGAKLSWQLKAEDVLKVNCLFKKFTHFE